MPDVVLEEEDVARDALDGGQHVVLQRQVAARGHRLQGATRFVRGVPRREKIIKKWPVLFNNQTLDQMTYYQTCTKSWISA